MRRKIVVFLTIVCLIGLIIYQLNELLNNHYISYMFNKDYNYERININNVLTSNSLENLKNIIPNSEESIVAILFNEDPKYNFASQYLYNRMILYPMTVSNVFQYRDIGEYNDVLLKNKLKENNINYFVIVGKNSKIYTANTKKDITVYKVEQKQILNKIYEYDIDLYTLKEEGIKYGNVNLFNNTLDKVVGYLESYKFLYGAEALNYLEDYAHKLYEEGNYDEAGKYYKICIDNWSIDTKVFYRMGKIYASNDKYDKAIEILNKCSLYEECPKEAYDLRTKIVMERGY